MTSREELGRRRFVEYKNYDFETIRYDYIVLDPLEGENVEKSMRVLKPGGLVVGIGGPPDPQFAKEIGASWFVGLATRFLSLRVRWSARRRGVRYARSCS